MLHLQYFDEILENQTNVTVIIPDKITGPLQTLYVLHGLGDDGSCWQRKTSLEALVADYQLAVIMPSVPRSWYLDQPHGPLNFSFITKSLPDHLNKLLPLSDKPEDRFILGNSMGGFGTLKWLSAYPNYFGAAVVLSPVVDLAVVPSLMPDYQSIFSSDALQTHQLSPDNPVFKKMPLYWAIGDHDFLLTQNKQFIQKMTLNTTSKFIIGAGQHDWQFWNHALAGALTWLPIKKNGDNLK